MEIFVLSCRRWCARTMRRTVSVTGATSAGGPTVTRSCRKVSTTIIKHPQDQAYFYKFCSCIFLLYRYRNQCFGFGFFSGSGSAKNPDPIRKSGSRSMKKTPYNYNFFYFPHWVQTVFFGHVAPKPIQKHHLDPISLLMDGSGFLQSGSRSAKNPDPSGSKTLFVIA